MQARGVPAAESLLNLEEAACRDPYAPAVVADRGVCTPLEVLLEYIRIKYDGIHL
jgi:hypothetical protein